MQKHFLIVDDDGRAHVIRTDSVERVSEDGDGIRIETASNIIVTKTYDLLGFCSNVLEDNSLLDAHEDARAA